MKKISITFDQLAMLSYLKFVKLDETDMTLLIKYISNIANVKIADDTDEYFITHDGNVILEKSYIEKFNRNIDIELFESISEYNIQRYLIGIDMLEFVLRKIKLLGPGCVIKDNIFEKFSLIQVRAIDKLYQEKFIMDYLHKDDYGDYKAIKLTKRGELALFLIDNKKAVDKFIGLLNDNGYNFKLVEAFLITQNLEKDLNDILTLNNFISFYNEFDINPYIEKNKHYSKIRTT